MEWIEVEIVDGNIIINIKRSLLIKNLGDQISEIGKTNGATPVEIQQGLIDLLGAEVKFGVIK